MSSILDLSFFHFTIDSVSLRETLCGKEQSPCRTYCELIYKISGESHQQIDDMRFTFEEGMLLFIPSGYSNYADITEKGSVVRVYFSISSETELHPELFQFGINTHFREQFLELAHIWQKGLSGVQFRCQSILYGIFADLIAEREKQYLSSTHYCKIAPAVAYIHENYLQPIQISDLTALCRISPQYLHQLFIHFLGKSPIDMVIQLRLKYARELLIHGRMTVEEVSHACGFHNVGYFSRAYKKRYHVSPGKRTDIPSEL